MDKYEAEGDYENPEYMNATEICYRNFACRLPDWPPELLYSLQQSSNLVYNTMWGPNEFVCQGVLRYWDITEELPTSRVLTLIPCGRYDEVTPLTCRSVHDHIGGSKFEVFERSAHSALWEERERYLNLILSFLDKHQ